MIDFFREHDMGGAWHRSNTRPLVNYVTTLKDIEHQFLDPELESRRMDLFRCATEMTRLLGQHSFPVRGDPEWSDLGVELDMDIVPDGPRGELWTRRCDLLNAGGTRVADAYDALIAAAARKLAL